MPDTAVIENEDALAADFDEAGEEEERPQTFAELGVPGPLVRVLAADGKKTAFPIQADTLPDSLPVVTFSAEAVPAPARPWRSRFRWSRDWVRSTPTSTRT